MLTDLAQEIIKEDQIQVCIPFTINYLNLTIFFSDGDRSSDARKKFISNINPDNVVDTDSVYEQLDKASSIHDSESGYGTGYGTMGKDYTFGKLPARKVRKVLFNYDYGVISYYTALCMEPNYSICTR